MTIQGRITYAQGSFPPFVRMLGGNMRRAVSAGVRAANDTTMTRAARAACPGAVVVALFALAACRGADPANVVQTNTEFPPRFSTRCS